MRKSVKTHIEPEKVFAQAIRPVATGTPTLQVSARKMLKFIILNTKHAVKLQEVCYYLRYLEVKNF